MHVYCMSYNTCKRRFLSSVQNYFCKLPTRSLVRDRTMQSRTLHVHDLLFNTVMLKHNYITGRVAFPDIMGNNLFCKFSGVEIQQNKS